MKNRCHKTSQQITGWLGLSESEQGAVRSHAAGCESCRQELEQALRVLARLEAGRESYQALRFTGKRPQAPEEMRSRWTERGRGGWSGRWWRPVPVPMALASVLFSVSAAIYLLSTSTSPPPSQPPPPAAETRAVVESQPVIRPPTIRQVSASKSLGAIRRQALQLAKPAAPKKPSGFSLRLPSRPRPPVQGRPEATAEKPE